MKAIETLAQKEVTRKQFLTIAGVGIASIFGIDTIMKLLQKSSASKKQMGSSSSSSYSSSDYGGKQ